MIVNFEGLDDKLACFIVPLYRTTFVEQPLIGTVTIQDQDLKNEKREPCDIFFLSHYVIFCLLTAHMSSAEYTISSFDSTEIVEIF
jgi:hypothetical protein